MRALAGGELDEADVLVVVERGGLPGGAADDHAVGPVVGEVAQHGDEGVLVDVLGVVERRDDGGQDGPEPGHGRRA